MTTKVHLWTGRALSGLVAALLFLDAVMKIVRPPPVVEGTVKMGYPESMLVGLGLVLAASVVLYVIPRTAILGAILLTGYLGGAVATHVRVGDGWFPILFPAFFGALAWGGLWFRDERLRALLPVAVTKAGSPT